MSDWLDTYLDELFEPIEDFSKKLEPLYMLLETSSLDHAARQDMEYRIMEIEGREDYEPILRELWDNQTDPIASGRNYSQTDIKNKLKQMGLWKHYQ